MGKGLICNCITICMQLHDLAPRYIYVGFILADVDVFTSVAFTHLGLLQITGHPHYQICPIVQPCPEKRDTSPEQDKACSHQDEPCPQKNKECSVCCVTAVFQCTATGTLPLTFTWWRNITNYSFMGRWIYSWWWETEGTVTERVNSNDTCFIQMVNDSTSQLSFSNTSVPIFEEYFCEVSDACGQSSKSEPALLLVYEGKIDNHTWCHYHLVYILLKKYLVSC